MSSYELLIDQAAATGLVAEKFRHVADLMGIQLGEVATAQTDHVGNRLGDEDPTCPEQWADKTLISLDDLAQGTDAPVVFSSLRTEEAAEYEDQFAVGRLVASNSAANRMRSDVALVSAYVNGNHIDELYARDMPGRIISAGNCVGAVLCPTLAPIEREIGIVSMHVTTKQGYSGSGAREIPEGVADTEPILGDEQDKIEKEPKRILGESIGKPAEMLITADPQRAKWLRGHQALVHATLTRETTDTEIQELWRSFRAPAALDPVKAQMKALSLVAGRHWPHKHGHITPVQVVYNDLVRHDPLHLVRVHPMRVKAHFIGVREDAPYDIDYELAGDNVILGAVGGNLLNVLYARAQGYI
jgi:aspartate-semialdehyde dehydrogenase